MSNFSLLNTEDPTNELINKKILLYKWISPKHLELSMEGGELEKISEGFKDIFSSNTPTEKISRVMQIAERIYRVIGSDKGQDKMLPSIIYCIIKSSALDIYREIQFMGLYRRRASESCRDGCTHGLSIGVRCECFLDKTYKEKEVGYYLTSFQAALDFIRKMEFYDLNITKGEFHQNIMDTIELVKDI